MHERRISERKWSHKFISTTRSSNQHASICSSGHRRLSSISASSWPRKACPLPISYSSDGAWSCKHDVSSDGLKHRKTSKIKIYESEWKLTVIKLKQQKRDRTYDISTRCFFQTAWWTRCFSFCCCMQGARCLVWRASSRAVSERILSAKSPPAWVHRGHWSGPIASDSRRVVCNRRCSQVLLWKKIPQQAQLKQKAISIESAP